ncbi:DNA helicase RecQ [Pseudopedobacter beijingensis]|uniref:DNA helicase RecQ n=1 Tax=Pseudopedobacter beijingensis TaxID=1207056 RepID=A0ABW4IEY2_9SPHI
MQIKKSLIDNLQTFFGFDNFKGDQEAIITSILNKEDTFVIMPTGGGKSICYQLPALMSEGTALVISPLIALMKNQVDQLRAFGGYDSIAHFLNSSLTKTETTRVKEDVTSGKTKLLYVAPESLIKQENIDFLQSITVSFVAVDEAHCISEWGHDFRPEYRKIRQVINNIRENIPVIALTATATPKVQNDIQKNLQMLNANVFKSSFNRSNLYYEVRPKADDILKDIIRYIKNNTGKSGIVYCLSRKKVEEVANALEINGIRSLPYHAGLDPKVRAETQDKFLMEEVDVIVATIAFGMGIDKPDVRYVIHHDVPKSMEGYYQETGRAGRDGGEGNCLAYYSEKDVDKLAKFMKDKPVAEREIGTQILKEVIDYSESAVCRRKQILHYFGENFNEAGCSDMCDNCRAQKQYFQAEEYLTRVLNMVKDFGEKFDDHHLMNVLMGIETAQVHSYKHQQTVYFGSGKQDGVMLWKSLIRQAVLNNFLSKDVDNFGLLKLTKSGKSYLTSPYSLRFILNREMKAAETEDTGNKQGGGALDTQLLQMLKDLRKKIAKQKNLPPFVIFQDPSLEEMCTHYPITMDELKHISGVGNGKAMKFGSAFLELINKYVEENEIDRPVDFVVKTTANKSALKVSIIQNIDRQISLEDIASAKGISFEDLLKEVESIVSSGTKLNIAYYIDEIIDEDRQDEVFDYFKSAEVDSIDMALDELGTDDYNREEIQLMRIKFLSELGN